MFNYKNSQKAKHLGFINILYLLKGFKFLIAFCFIKMDKNMLHIAWYLSWITLYKIYLININYKSNINIVLYIVVIDFLNVFF